MCVREAVRLFAMTAMSVGVVHGIASAQGTRPAAAADWSGDPPAIAALVAEAKTESVLRVAVDRYLADKGAIERRYEIAYSPARLARSIRWIRAAGTWLSSGS